MQQYVITADDQGSLKFVFTPELNFLQSLGVIETKRASYVEPDFYLLRVLFHWLREKFGEVGRVADWTRSWKCLWRVNMSPSNGPILAGKWVNRQDALNAEIVWLTENL